MNKFEIILDILLMIFLIHSCVGYRRLIYLKQKNFCILSATKLYKSTQIENSILLEASGVKKQITKKKSVFVDKTDEIKNIDEDVILTNTIDHLLNSNSIIDTKIVKKKRSSKKVNLDIINSSDFVKSPDISLTGQGDISLAVKSRKPKVQKPLDTEEVIESVPNLSKSKRKKTNTTTNLDNNLVKSSKNIMSVNKVANLYPPTLEQQLIIDAVRNAQAHIRVRAVAGSGKTTTTLNIATELSHMSILILLYNSKLKDETRSKIEKLKLKNLEAHSFHAFGSKYYSQNCYKDAGLEILCKDDLQPRSTFSYDVIVVDEVQDMKPSLFKFVNKVMRDNRKDFILLLLGDEKQTIYGYDGADSRYLTLSDKLYDTRNTKPWKEMSLSTTFRLSGNIAKFMNKFIVGYDLFQSINKCGEKVRYYWGDLFACVREIHSELVTLLASGQYEPSDIFVLANSVKNGKADKKTPLNVLANMLRDSGYSIYTPDNDDSNGSRNKEKAMDGKIVIDTYHSTKGMERKVVVNFGFSLGYFNYFNKDAEDRTSCPPIFYVGATRASERLIIVGEGVDGERFPFLKDIENNDFLEIKKVGRSMTKEFAELKSDSPFSRFTPTSLVDYLPDHVIKDAMKYIKVNVINEPSRMIPLKSIIETAPGLFEEVSLVNGLAIPALYESRNCQGRSSIQNEALRIIRNNNSDTSFDKSLMIELDNTFPNNNMSAYLRLATIYNYANTGFISKVSQISKFDWIDLEEAEKCMKILSEHLGGQKVDYECNINHKFESNNGTEIRLSGRTDALTDSVLWELKCTEKLEETHILQLAVYAWMKQQQKDYSKDMKFKLLNMRTNELLELVSDFNDLDNTIKLLVEHKIKGESNISDEDFIEQNLKIRNGK